MAVSLREKMLAITGTPGNPQHSVEVLDEGVSLTTKVQTINFVGAAVTAGNTVNDVTVTISTSLGGIDGGTPSTPPAAYSFKWDFGGVT